MSHYAAERSAFKETKHSAVETTGGISYCPAVEVTKLPADRCALRAADLAAQSDAFKAA